jgi:hypothetical protein
VEAVRWFYMQKDWKFFSSPKPDTS